MRKLPELSGDAAPHVLPSTNIVSFPQHDRGESRRAKDTKSDGVFLTKAAVKKLALPAGKGDVVFWDSALTGFGLRIRAGGKRTWMVQFRDGNGVTKKVTIGSVDTVEADDARTQAKKILGGVAIGQDPAKAKREARAAEKFGELVEKYLAYAKGRQKPRTIEETTRNVKVRAKPLHSTAVKDITRSDIARLHEKITAKNGPVTANRALAALSGFFSWSIGKGYRDDNPAMAIPKNAEAARERVLTDSEIRAIWHGTGSGSDHDRILRLLLLTGARRSEVGSMKWSELTLGEDQDVAIWTVPGDRMKNGLAHEVPLTKFALQQLPETEISLPPTEEERAPGTKFVDGSTKFVFGKEIDGARRGFSGWSRSKQRLDRRLGFSDWGLHDFRRTFSTRLNEAGVQPHVVEALLAHVSGHKAGVAGTYNKASYRAQKREALELWTTMIEKIVGA